VAKIRRASPQRQSVIDSVKNRRLILGISFPPWAGLPARTAGGTRFDRFDPVRPRATTGVPTWRFKGSGHSRLTYSSRRSLARRRKSDKTGRLSSAPPDFGRWTLDLRLRLPASGFRLPALTLTTHVKEHRTRLLVASKPQAKTDVPNLERIRTFPFFSYIVKYKVMFEAFLISSRAMQTDGSSDEWPRRRCPPALSGLYG
jgi:hypothetical protein